jgi:spore germination protein KB
LNKKVTSKQLTHAAAVLIMATSILTKHLYVYTKNDAWLIVILSFFVSSAIYFIYSVLANKFPGFSLIEINKTVFGFAFGKIVSILYIYFFFTIAALNTNVVGNFTKAFILPSTPMIYILVVFVAVCVWAVQKGSQNLMKYSVLFSFLAIAIILLNALLLMNDYNAANFLPGLSLSASDYLVGMHSLSMIPLCDPFVLLMFMPDLQKPKEFGKALLLGLLIGALVLLLIVLRDIGVLGQSSELFTFPSFSTIRMINAGDIITRMDIIYIATLISLMFYKVSVFLCAAVSGIQRLNKLNSYQFMLYSLGTLLILYAMIVFRSAGEHTEWLINGASQVHHTFFVVLLPLLTLIVAVCRGFFKQPMTAAE